MLNWIAKQKVNAFGRRWGYDTGYMREILDEVGAGALLPLDALQKVGKYRRGIPAAVYCAAKLTAARAADCGPCLQLTASMAEAEGIPLSLIRVLISGDRAALPEDVRLGADLADATIARDSGGEAARQQILKRWGRQGLVSLAYAIVVAQAFPTLKYALGHGHACVRVKVGGADVPVKATAAA